MDSQCAAVSEVQASYCAAAGIKVKNMMCVCQSWRVLVSMCLDKLVVRSDTNALGCIASRFSGLHVLELHFVTVVREGRLVNGIILLQ